MKKKLLSVLKYLVFLAIGIFLVWWQFDKMTPDQKDQFGRSLDQANYWLLIPIIIMALLSHLSRALRWKILMEPLGYKPSTANSFYAVMTGYLANTFLPRAGEVIKCSLLSKYEKLPMNKLVGTIIVERIFDLVCYVIFIVFTILVQLHYVSGFVKEIISEIVSSQGAAGWLKLAALILGIILIIYLTKLAFKKYAEHRYMIKLKNFHIGLMEGIGSIRHLKKRGLFFGHTIFIWLMYLLQIYVGFSALSATSGLNIAQACSVLSLATLGMIVFPGGIGAFPLAVQQVLLVYKIDNASFGWLMWGVSTGIIIVGGILSFIILVYKGRKNIGTEQPVMEPELINGNE